MKSPGTEYFDELGLEIAKSFSDMKSILMKKIGEEKTDAFIAMIYKRGEAQSKGRQLDEKEFYEFKNQSFESGIHASATFDGDIIVKTCDWIAENKDVFGKRILDVGCDTGIVSCFLAKQLPESLITAIDDGSNAIGVAKTLATKLGVSNISFECSNVKEINEQYDTVFSSRTLHENLSKTTNTSFLPFK